MKPFRATLTILIFAGFLAGIAASEKPEAPSRDAISRQIQAGQFKDAYDGLRQLALDPADDPAQVGDDLTTAARLLQQLGRLDELDEFRDAVVRIHAENWRLLWAAADTYLANEHAGVLVAGKFSRGPSHGELPAAVDASQRDRARALQLMARALPLAAADPDRPRVARFYLDLARALLATRGYGEAWRLQSLTNLTELPGYDEAHNSQSANGAPVGDDGKPVFYAVPNRWEDAANDGQRWRWALARAAASDPAQANEVRWQLADFLQSQFGVETLADDSRFFARLDDESDSPVDAANADTSKAADGKAAAAKPVSQFTLHTLADDETLARLATGIQRFKLPPEFDFVRIYQQIAAEPKTGRGAEALERLAQIFENRRQYPRAAEFWQRAIEQYGAGPHDARPLRLEQITGNWGRFEPTASQPAGKGATVGFRFRNGRRVSFTAREVLVEKLLADVKAYLRSNPHPLDQEKLSIENIGTRLVEKNQESYLGQQAAAWNLDLKPPPDHRDRQIAVAMPLQKAGCYLLTAQMADGNASHILVWIDDTAIVKKPLADGTFYYVADATTGQPIAGANVDCFGYRSAPAAQGKPDNVETIESAEQTDADGQLIAKAKPGDSDYSWLITATAPGSRFAFLGFTHVWYPEYPNAQYDQTRVFTITDRPVYRPGQTVKFKFWVGRARYDQPDAPDSADQNFANQDFTIEVQSPQGKKLLARDVTSDAFGGVEGEFALPADAPLGVYSLALRNQGGGSFRVEECKMPEYEVIVDTPSEPAMLGGRIKATIRARNYSGFPVTEARVKYTVRRTGYSASWRPVADWDWLYGRGYGWFAYDAPWYPGWSQWGCHRPAPSESAEALDVPEIVAQREVPIGRDGTVPVEIDTALAQAIHPDQDDQYDITAEVIDASGHTVVGSGRVLVGRQPFRVFSWVDRGFYRADDVIRAEFFAQTLDAKPVRGDGKASLLKIAYQDGKPVETRVRDWDLSTDAEGRAKLQIKAPEPGHYRLSFKLADSKKQTAEGACLITIAGQGSEAADFRCNPLELIPDRSEYAPGETVNLMIRADRPGSAVLLFVRPAGGVYLKPKLLRLAGKSTVEEIRVQAADMPNFFVEALTISDGHVASELKEIAVPPAQRVLNVTVTPARDVCEPGQRATVALKLTDRAGHPFVGSVVVSIYDKSLDTISGGSSLPHIKEFYWKWRRGHAANSETNLNRFSENLTRPKQHWMEILGMFGDGSGDASRGPAANALSLGGTGAPLDTRTDPAAPLPQGAFSAQAAFQPDRRGSATSGKTSAPATQPTTGINFASTALWVGSLSTNEKGEAEVSLDLPNSLTTWKVKAWAMGHGTKVGQGEAEIVIRKAHPAGG